jgi:negative regulator of genetic competence, sporulation and motility
MIMNYSIVENILDEPEFKENGMVWKHIKSGRSDQMVAVRSAVDRMRELHDIEDRDFNDICFEVLKGIQAKIAGF